MFRTKKLSELGEIVSGGTPRTKNVDFWNGNIPWITPKDLSSFNQRFISKGQRDITSEGLNNSSARLLPAGSVLFTSRAPIGYIAIAEKELTTNQGFKSIIVNENNYNLFIYYLLENNISRIENFANGSTFREISGSIMKDLKFKVPSLKEQKAIANILSTLDEKIEVNNQINETLEEMAQELFKRWFVDFEFPDENGEPYKSSGGEMVESELGLIPKGWEVRFLESISEIKSGKRPRIKNETYSNAAKVPIAGASSIMGYTNDYNFDSSILVIGRVGTHGIIQRFNNQVWASDNTLVITSKYYEFVYQILKNIDYNSLNRGSTQPLITQKDIKNCKIILPKVKVLENFENTTSSFFNLIDNNKEEINKLISIRDTLLPKLMSGEIRVPLEETEEIMVEAKGG